MRLNKTSILLLTALWAVPFQSCLKDQKDIFDEPATVRLQNYLDNAKKVLTDAQEGWLFDYFPDRDLSYGGFLYSLRFDEKEVAVGCELAPGVEETSLYKLTDDNGPCLSFDSYNSLMHFFATPSITQYEALDGDFEFVIMDVDAEKGVIKLRGKRTGNTMYLRRAESDVKAYIEKTAEMSNEQFFSAASGTIGGNAVTAGIDTEVRYFELAFDGQSEETYGAYYLATPEGLRFPEPLELPGAALTALSFDPATATYTGSDSSGAQVSLNAKLPDDYALIGEYEGEFTFEFSGKKVDVTLVPDAEANTVTMKGISPGFDLVCLYKRSKGCIDLSSQLVASYPTLEVYFCYGNAGGFYTQNGLCGTLFKKDIANPGKFNAVPYDNDGGTPANDFIIVVWQDDWYLSADPWLIAGEYSIAGVTSLTKK